jgi:hypothetical protein
MPVKRRISKRREHLSEDAENGFVASRADFSNSRMRMSLLPFGLSMAIQRLRNGDEGARKPRARNTA